MRIPLVGLNGENPLAFLASVGVLRILSQSWPDCHVRMTWEATTSWKPILIVEKECSSEEVVDALTKSLEGRKDAFEFNRLGKDLPVPCSAFVEVARSAIVQVSQRHRTTADFLAAFGSEGCPVDDLIQETALRTMSGAGHQHFLGSMQEIAGCTTAEHCRSALFEAWSYRDSRPSMRWDPQDDRRYALRASDPGNSNQSPIQTMRGANWLAIEALPCFPTIPTDHGAKTRALYGTGVSTILCWPIWKVPISIQALGSLLAHVEIQAEKPRREHLQPLGVCEVFHSRRLTVGRFRSFTMGVPCWGSLL